MGTGGLHATVGASDHKRVTAKRSAHPNVSPPTHTLTAGRDEKIKKLQIVLYRYYWVQEIPNKMSEINSMGSTCRCLTKGFPAWLKLMIHGPYIHLGKHLPCAWFIHTNAVSHSFLPYSIRATHHGQPGSLSHVSALSPLSRSGLHLLAPQVS